MLSVMKVCVWGGGMVGVLEEQVQQYKVKFVLC